MAVVGGRERRGFSFFGAGFDNLSFLKALIFPSV